MKCSTKDPGHEHRCSLSPALYHCEIHRNVVVIRSTLHVSFHGICPSRGRGERAIHYLHYYPRVIALRRDTPQELSLVRIAKLCRRAMHGHFQHRSPLHCVTILTYAHIPAPSRAYTRRAPPRLEMTYVSSS